MTGSSSFTATGTPPNGSCTSACVARSSHVAVEMSERVELAGLDRAEARLELVDGIAVAGAERIDERAGVVKPRC